MRRGRRHLTSGLASLSSSIHRLLLIGVPAIFLRRLFLIGVIFLFGRFLIGGLVSLAIFLPRILLIGVLCLFGRFSLALYVWGKGRLVNRVARISDADPRMYQRPRWKNTRVQVYHRNIKMNKNRGGSRKFVCELTGKQSDDLGLFHVDHILARSRFPLLAYRLDNLRLITAKANREKSDDLSIWFFVKFAISNKIR